MAIHVSKLWEMIRTVCDDRDVSVNTLKEIADCSWYLANRIKEQVIEHDLSYEKLSELDEKELTQLFFPKRTLDGLVEPDCQACLDYMSSRVTWANKRCTYAIAWRNFYVRNNFPDYDFCGPLPKGCASLSTFERRLNEYKVKLGIKPQSRSRQTNSFDFKPGGVMEIDTIGDRFTYYDHEGNENKVILFVAIPKFSKMAYVEALEDPNGLAWTTATINAAYAFGGACEVLRTDNDAAITIHGNKKKGTKTKPTYMFENAIRKLNMTIDLCPIHSPTWKASVERFNRVVQYELFSNHNFKERFYAKDLNDLNKKIREEVNRINLIQRGTEKISPYSLFKLHEEKCLKPLPLTRPEANISKLVTVLANDYVRYDFHYYYVGANMSDISVIVEEVEGGNTLALYYALNFQEICRYPHFRNRLDGKKFHKADCFKEEDEQVVTRTISYFEDDCKKWNAPDCVFLVMKEIWSSFPSSPPVATRLCNSFRDFCLARKAQQDDIENSCKAILRNKSFEGSAFNKKLQILKDLYPANEAASVLSTVSNNIPADNEACLRGGEYYEQL